MSGLKPDDNDRLIAAVDLVGRSGARNFEVGYLHDDVPAIQAAWWASARYKGTIIMVENEPDPWSAAEHLAVKLLTGGQCQGCGGLVALEELGGFAFFNATLVDGRSWTALEAVEAGLCRWERKGDKWIAGCGGVKREPPAGPNRAQRRGNKERRRRR